MRSFVLNPFFIIAASYFLAYSAYLLPFSEVYPKLDFPAAAPGLYFICLNIIAGIIWYLLRLSSVSVNSVPINAQFKINFIGLLSCVLIILELGMYGVPVLGHVSYTDFGAPILHVVIVSSLIVLSVSSIILNRNYKWFLITLVIAIVILNRFLLIFVLVSFLFFHLSNKNFNFKSLFKSFLFISFVIFLFGMIGTWRMANILDISYWDAQKYILIAGNASEIYIETGFPVSFFWFWLYLTSPISNLIYNFELGNHMVNTDFITLAAFEFLPQTISKHLGDYPYDVKLLVEHLNVSSAIAPSFIAIGFLGITLYFVYYAFVFFFFTMILKGLYRYTLILILSALSVFMIFFNVIVMPIFIFSIGVLFMLSMKCSRSY